jgi:hypothetical protein
VLEDSDEKKERLIVFALLFKCFFVNLNHYFAGSSDEPDMIQKFKVLGTFLFKEKYSELLNERLQNKVYFTEILHFFIL